MVLNVKKNKSISNESPFFLKNEKALQKITQIILIVKAIVETIFGGKG